MRLKMMVIYNKMNIVPVDPLDQLTVARFFYGRNITIRGTE